MSYELEIKSNRSRLNQIAAILANNRAEENCFQKIAKLESQQYKIVLIGADTYNLLPRT